MKRKIILCLVISLCGFSCYFLYQKRTEDILIREWGLMLLCNHASFKQGSSLSFNTSAFVAKYNDELYGCTAKHILGDQAPESKAIKSHDVNREKQFWYLSPKDSDAQKINLKYLVNDFISHDDWLVFKADTLPIGIEAFKIRKEPVKVHEKLYFLGCPAKSFNCKQQFFEAEVISIIENQFICIYEPWENINGFSGGPIFDADKYLVGIVVKANFNSKLKKHVTVTGENVNFLKAMIMRDQALPSD